MKPRYFVFAIVEAETMRDACEAVRRDMDERLRQIDDDYEQRVVGADTVEAMIDAMTGANGQSMVVRAMQGVRLDMKRSDDPAEAAAQLRSWARQVEEWEAP